MISVEERITYLDNLMAELARAQVQTEIALKASGGRMDAHVSAMKEDTSRMKEDTRRMKKSMDATFGKMDEETRKLKKSMDATFGKMDEETRKMKQAWGNLANKMGTVAEDVVAPNIPRLAVEELGFAEVEDLMVRVRRASRRGEKRHREWDVICSGPGKVIVVEVKSTPSVDNIREVPERLAEFFDFFPEYEGRERIGALASWSIHPELRTLISEMGFYGLAMGEETMEIVARPGGV